MKRCYECKQGEQVEDYDDDIVLCEIVEDVGKKPKRVNLCAAHRFSNDFVSCIELNVPVKHVCPVKVKPPVYNLGKTGTVGWTKAMDRIVQYWTGWESLEQMCQNNPTLAVTRNTPPEEAVAIRTLREGFKFINGREAYPVSGTYGSGI